ncbi:MAG: hypothetical protein GC191_15530 [Azospirillum sp.]|nr:hypothetical protein [Azospirillum sp.]
MRKLLLIAVVLLIPTTAHAASSLGSAILGLAIGGVLGVVAMPYVLPTAVATAPVVIEAVSAGSAAAGTAIVQNPVWAGGIIGAILGLSLAP